MRSAEMNRSELCELSSALKVNEIDRGIMCCVQFVLWFLQSDMMCVHNIISSRTNAEAWHCVECSFRMKYVKSG